MSPRAPRLVVILEQPAHHRLAFRLDELERGIGHCPDCGARVETAAWPLVRCAGPPESRPWLRLEDLTP